MVAGLSTGNKTDGKQPPKQTSEGRAAAMKIDFIDQIFEKYQKTVLEAMGGHEEKHRQLDRDMKDIKRELGNISTFLNGEVQKAQKRPRNFL